jgi:AraC-like DNA-binding protein
MSNLNTYIDESTFNRIRSSYESAYPVSLCAVDPAGKVILSLEKDEKLHDPLWCQIREVAIKESLRWGEPILYDQPAGYFTWAVPLMHNASVIGGLVAYSLDRHTFCPEGQSLFDLTQACQDLYTLAVNENVTNDSLLTDHRNIHQREQKRAEAIHNLKSQASHNVLQRYLIREPAIISAIKRGDRKHAVEIINMTLTEIYYLGEDHLDIIKSLVMELIVTMSRTAIASGGASMELLGINYSSLSDLSRIDNEERLARWLVEMLNKIMDTIERQNKPDSLAGLEKGIDFITTHFNRHISREHAANEASLSESHFARLLKEKTGLSFTELLNRTRLDHAAELLRKTNLGVMQIAMQTGFADQSYFTRVFRKQFRQTPGRYRSKHQSR